MCDPAGTNRGEPVPLGLHWPSVAYGYRQRRQLTRYRLLADQLPSASGNLLGLRTLFHISYNCRQEVRSRCAAK